MDIIDTINDINSMQGSAVYECLGFLDDDMSLHRKTVRGLKVLGPLCAAHEFTDCNFINGIGSAANFWKKRSLVTQTADLDRFESIIHPSASISRTARIGRGTVIFQNVTITSNVSVGRHVVVLPNSVISHDGIVGDYTSICAGVCISGNVRIGSSCYLGTNSAVIGNIDIGDFCLIGMGSVVLESVPANSTVVGNPARFLRKTIDSKAMA